MNTIIAERRILATSNRSVPPAADRAYKLGEQALVYHENKKQWEGLYIVVYCARKWHRNKTGKITSDVQYTPSETVK